MEGSDDARAEHAERGEGTFSLPSLRLCAFAPLRLNPIPIPVPMIPIRVYFFPQSVCGRPGGVMFGIT